MSEPSILDLAGAVVEALERDGFDYAVGGAIALGYWAAPRATIDIDIGVDVDTLRIPDLIESMIRAGCDVDREQAMRAASRGDFGARIHGIRIDVFLPVFPLAAEAIRRRVRVPFGPRDAWILTAEDIALLKLVFGRTKDFADLERLFAAQRGRLDEAYLERWVATTFDPTDPRRLKFEELREKMSSTT